MTPEATFLWGFAGSFAYEVVTIFHIYNSPTIQIPERFKRIGFWIVRFLLAVVAGGLAVAYDIQKPILALNIGAAAPLLIQAFAQGIHQPTLTIKKD